MLVWLTCLKFNRTGTQLPSNGGLFPYFCLLGTVYYLCSCEVWQAQPVIWAARQIWFARLNLNTLPCCPRMDGKLVYSVNCKLVVVRMWMNLWNEWISLVYFNSMTYFSWLLRMAFDCILWTSISLVEPTEWIWLGAALNEASCSWINEMIETFHLCHAKNGWKWSAL